MKENVKILATKHDPNESLLLITLDEFTRLARKLNHNELLVYEELYRQCGRLQGKN